MEQFSSNEFTSLDKTVESNQKIRRTKTQDVVTYYELAKIIDYIKSNDSKRVCLQFLDYMLQDSYEIATRLKQALDNPNVYIMGDSNYESCCVDYVTAQHVNADVIIHFGPRCSSEWTGTIPCLCIYEKGALDVKQFVGKLTKEFLGRFQTVHLKLDTPYLYLKTEIEDELRSRGFSVIEERTSERLCLNLYVGENNRNLLNYQLEEKVDSLYFYDPTAPTAQFTPYGLNRLLLKRRNFLREKIKDSQRVGIVIATLVIKNFLKALERVKTLLRLHGKKYYVLSVGRPTVAKLANFPEMDVYVLVCCPSSSIFDSRDFFKPIVTLYDVEMALNATRHAENTPFTYGIDEELLNCAIDRGGGSPDVSLISGEVRCGDFKASEDETSNGTEVVLKDKGVVAVGNSGAEFLSNRSFRGLEQKLGETEVKLVEEGEKGIAQGYDKELF